MDNGLYLFGGGLIVLGLVISLVGHVRTKRGGKTRWGYWMVGMAVLAIGLALQMWLESMANTPA
jgi:hypothetical protein